MPFLGPQWPVSSGRVILDDVCLTDLSFDEVRPYRRKFQVVFSDQYGQLTSEYTLDRIFREVIRAWNPKHSREEIDNRIEEAMAYAGLPAASRRLTPGQITAAERQLAALARALLIRPELIVFHEVTKGLDAPSQAEMFNRIRYICERLEIARLFICDKFEQGWWMGDSLSVLRGGKIVESGDAERVVRQPEHDYTKRLVSCSLGGSERH
ncbi:MAG: ATP-binding cassette domain-containing protein [Verrucomicrobiota bacterium]